MSASAKPGDIRSLILVYNADWGVRGGIDYLLGMLRSASDCALCALTHRGVVQRQEWGSCRAALGVPVEAHYRNRLEPAVAAAVGRAYPAVLARTAAGVVPLLGPGELAACAGVVETLQRLLLGRARQQNLAWG